MAVFPKMKTNKFMPGLESEHEVGLSGVGVSVVCYTIAVNTARTPAQLIASPPNTAGLNIAGPLVHSLGAPPTAVIPLRADTSEVTEGNDKDSAVTFQYCTADNSAVYIWANAYSGGPTAAYVRLVAIR